MAVIAYTIFDWLLKAPVYKPDNSYFAVCREKSPPFLRLTFKKPLWLDTQPADIKSRWRHNWKSAEVVISQL